MLDKRFLMALLVISSLIFALPIELTDCNDSLTAGDYVLINDVDATDPNCFSISSSDIILDCNGYAILDGSGSGISTSDALSNITIKNCNITGFSSYGIIINDDITNLTIENNHINNNSDGILIDNGDNAIISNNKIYSNSNNGITISPFAEYANITKNKIYDNGLGISIQSANNIIYDNYLNNTVNTDDATGSSWNITLQSAGIEGNIMGGPYISGNFYGDATCTTESPTGICSDTDYLIGGSAGVYDEEPLWATFIDTWSPLSDNTLYVLTSDFDAGTNLAMNTGISLNCDGHTIVSDGSSTIIDLGSNQLRNCILSGGAPAINVDAADAIVFNNTIFNSTFGITIHQNCNNVTVSRNTIHDSETNVFIEAPVTFLNNHLYNSTDWSDGSYGIADLVVNFYDAGTFNMLNTIFDSPQGGFSNYTNLSMNATDPSSILISHSENYSSLPSGYTSFANTFINMSAVSVIDSLVWHWKDEDLSGYNESKFVLSKYNGTWTDLNSTPDTISNQLSIFNLDSFSNFGLLEDNGSSVPSISWAEPTPPNGTNNFTYGMAFNFTSDLGMSNCFMEIDGINKTGSLAADNLSCSYQLNYSEHIFNNTYDVIGYANVSGTMYPINETRVVPYYGCGLVLSNATMIGNIIRTGGSCLGINDSNINFNGAGYSISGDGSGNGIFMSNGNSRQDITLENTIINGFNSGIALHEDASAPGDANILVKNNTISNVTYCVSSVDAADCAGCNFTGNRFSNATYGISILLHTNEFSYNISNNNFSNILFEAISFNMSGNMEHTDYLSNNHYTNTSGLFFADSSSELWTLQLENEIIDSPTGGYTNYSNISVSLLETSPFDLNIFWAAPAPAPDGYSIVKNKFINMTSSAPPTINATFYWLETDWNVSSWCFQRGANGTQAGGADSEPSEGSCNQNYSGIYSTFTNGTLTNPTYWHDGDLTTYTQFTTGGAGTFFYVNATYIKPENATNESLYLHKMATANQLRNSSIPESCWNYSETNITFQFSMSITGALNYNLVSCFNGTDMVLMNSTPTIGYPNRLFDEGMWWSIQSYPYNESKFHLFKYNGTWTDLNDTPDTTNNMLTVFDLYSFGSIGILQLDFSAYFTAPTPSNNSNVTGNPILNLTATSEFNDCLFDIDGTNYTGTMAADNLSCTYTISPTSSGHQYEVLGWANKSGSYMASNETRVFTWYDTATCIQFITAFNITQNQSTYVKPTDTLMYVIGTITLNNTCPTGINDSEYDIDDGVADASWTSYLINISGNEVKNFSNYPYRISINFTNDGNIGSIGIASYGNNEKYTLSTPYARNVSLTNINVSLLGNLQKLYVCEITPCDTNDAADWALVPSNIIGSTMLRLGDYLYSSTIYVQSFQYEGGDNGGGGDGGGGGYTPPTPTTNITANQTSTGQEVSGIPILAKNVPCMILGFLAILLLLVLLKKREKR